MTIRGNAVAPLERPHQRDPDPVVRRVSELDVLFNGKTRHDVHRRGEGVDWCVAPHPLANSTAEELAKLPMYYVMDLDKTMPETVAPYMPSPVEVAGCRWLTENDIDVYVTEYERTGFQGALQWYRVQVGRPDLADLQLFAGRRIDVPSMFIAGCSDWAVYLIPGAFERSAVCTRMEDCRFVKDAGHWLQ